MLYEKLEVEAHAHCFSPYSLLLPISQDLIQFNEHVPESQEGKKQLPSSFPGRKALVCS